MNRPAAVNAPIAVNHSPRRPSSSARTATASAETLRTTGKWLMIRCAYGHDNISLLVGARKTRRGKSERKAIGHLMSLPSNACELQQPRGEGRKSKCKPLLQKKLGYTNLFGS